MQIRYLVRFACTAAFGLVAIAVGAKEVTLRHQD